MLSGVNLVAAAIAALLGTTVLCPLRDNGPAVAGATSVVQAVAKDTATVRLTIGGMTCGSCATTARIALQRVPGVYKAEVSYDSASAVVRYDPEKTSPERFIAELQRMTGYEASVVNPRDPAKPKF